MDKKLDELLREARERTMTPEEREEQRINFALGNAPKGSKSTIETIRKAASKIMKQTRISK
jgi:hypothetical protein